MVDKDFCLSSYMAFRYIYKDDVDFYEGFRHAKKLSDDNEKIEVSSAEEIDREIKKQFEEVIKKYKSVGILLSGGMDSGILASYLKEGSHAYTFTTKESNVYKGDVERAKYYAEKNGLNLHYVDIAFDDYKRYTPIVMKSKCAPVHSIEPQIYKAAIQAKEDGVEILVTGESADLHFGGMDQLLSKDWKFWEFVERYTFLKPELVLKNSKDMTGAFEPFKKGEYIDFIGFMDNVFSIESAGSYINSFGVANMPFCDPYAKLFMKKELDLNRVRNGEPKYLIRELFALKYPNVPIPNKIPMPRPVDAVFRGWTGPKRPEFRDDIFLDKLTGNQKWQLWCAELFLNINERLDKGE